MERLRENYRELERFYAKDMNKMTHVINSLADKAQVFILPVSDGKITGDTFEDIKVGDVVIDSGEINPSSRGTTYEVEKIEEIEVIDWFETALSAITEDEDLVLCSYNADGNQYAMQTAKNDPPKNQTAVTITVENIGGVDKITSEVGDELIVNIKHSKDEGFEDTYEIFKKIQEVSEEEPSWLVTRKTDNNGVSFCDIETKEWSENRHILFEDYDDSGDIITVVKFVFDEENFRYLNCKSSSGNMMFTTSTSISSDTKKNDFHIFTKTSTFYTEITLKELGSGGGHVYNNEKDSLAEGTNTTWALNTASGVRSHAEGHGTIASGENSHAEGNLSVASAVNSHAEGESTVASGVYSHAEGLSTNSVGVCSHSEGQNTNASGNFAHAEGFNTISTQVASHSEGQNSEAKGNFAHAEGFNSKANGEASHAEGHGTLASTLASHAEGQNTEVNAVRGHAEGFHTIVNAENAHTEGQDTIARGISSHAEGVNTITEAQASHTEGIQTIARSVASHAEGQGSQANNVASHAEGSGTNASGSFSHAEGLASKSIGESSHAEGNNTEATGNFSHAEGILSKSIGESSHAEGNNTEATGLSSHAEGFSGKSLGNYSHVEGNGCVAQSEGSHAEGFQTSSVGNFSHTEGLKTKTDGEASHAEGNQTEANYNHSHAEGLRSKANAQVSHAEGQDTVTGGMFSHTEGMNTVTTNEAEHAEGKYNKSSSITAPQPIEYVDLGLPSGLLWTKTNIGAQTETDYGQYFAWGEIVQHEGWPSDKTSHPYNWNEYQYAVSTANELTKYCNNSNYGYNGYTDSLTELVSTDDVATVILGASYRMPTQEDFQELINGTDNERTTINGVNGWKFMKTDDHDIYIFLPAAGKYDKYYWDSDGYGGFYWSSRLNANDCIGALVLSFNNTQVKTDSYDYRCYGHSIRPVISSSDLSKVNTIHSIGIGSADDDRKNAVEVMDNGDVYVYGVGGYDGTNPDMSIKMQDLIPQYKIWKGTQSQYDNLETYDSSTLYIII